MPTHDVGPELPTWVRWVLGAFFVVPLAVFVVVNFVVGEEQPDGEDRAEIAKLEDTLRPLGPVEDALTRYEAAMQQIADELSAQHPGMTWRWDQRVSRSRCLGELEDTNGVQLDTRDLVADRPIPDDGWAPAHQLVRDRASGIGVRYVSGFEVPGGRGGAIDLSQRDVAVLSGVTPCQLRRADL